MKHIQSLMLAAAIASAALTMAGSAQAQDKEQYIALPSYRVGPYAAGGPGSPNWWKSNALKTMRAKPELQGKLLARGQWDYELVDALKPEPGDICLHKTRYSGFFNSQLDSVLRARGIRHLMFVGIATNVCVESTLRDGFFLEYFGTVREDATHQAGPDFVQKAALFNIETFFGWVTTTADFKGAFGQLAPQT